MSRRTDHDEERIAELLQLLPPAPESWVAAAKQLPAARAAMDALVARAEADAELRSRVVAELDAAIRAEGIESQQRIVEALRRRLDA